MKAVTSSKLWKYHAFSENSKAEWTERRGITKTVKSCCRWADSAVTFYFNFKWFEHFYSVHNAFIKVTSYTTASNCFFPFDYGNFIVNGIYNEIHRVRTNFNFIFRYFCILNELFLYKMHEMNIFLLE